MKQTRKEDQFNMNSNTVEHKLSIFLSSKCGGRYAIMRKALKQLLIETGLIDVYCFEMEPGSSESMPSAYLDIIETTQLFILIVDNKDNITTATLSEYKRAKELGKRIIAIFCNEDSKEKTEVEKEIIELRLCKYDTAPAFSDIAGLAYKAVIQDMVAVYKKRKEQPLTTQKAEMLADDSSAEPSSKSTVSTIPTGTVSSFIEKKILTGFNNVQKAFVNVTFRNIENITYSSELDELTCRFLQVVLCNAKFDSNQFSLLKPLILEKHSDSIKKIIDMRLDAVQFYLSSDLDACINKLNEVIKISLSDSSIPKWICNDIAIDLRNMLNTKSNMNGNISIHNNDQKIIDESEEYLFFPAIDRLSSNVKEAAIKEYNRIYLQSPYTVSLGGLEVIFKDVASYFCIALLYGSITHIKIVKDLLIDILQALRQEYSDPEFNTELIKLLILRYDDITLENIIRTFNQPYSIISSIEIQKILDAIKNLPYQHEQTHAKLLLLKHFGEYFLDEQYTIIIDWLSDYLESIKNVDARIAFMHNEIVKQLFISNSRRIPAHLFVDYVKWLLSFKSFLSVATACDLFRYLPYNEIAKNEQIALRKLLREVILKNKDMHKLDGAIIAFCKNATIDISPLETAIQAKMNSFYKGVYYLEMYVNDKKSSLSWIHKQTTKIKNRIQIQSQNEHIGYGDNPFATISNIIVLNSLNLNDKEQAEIVQTACDFLKSPNQSAREKISAIELLTSMFLSFSRKNILKQAIQKLEENQEEVTKVYDDFFDKTSISSLAFVFDFLLLLTNPNNVEQAMPSILNISVMDDRDIISCLSFISKISDRIFYNDLPNEVITSLFQLYVSLQRHKERDVKYLATKCLIPLANSKYQQIVLKQLSNCMDSENPEIKIAIVHQVKKLKCDSSIKHYIIQKAAIDSNFIVRDIACCS